MGELFIDSFVGNNIQWDKLFEEVNRIMKPGGGFEVKLCYTRIYS